MSSLMTCFHLQRVLSPSHLAPFPFQSTLCASVKQVSLPAPSAARSDLSPLSPLLLLPYVRAPTGYKLEGIRRRETGSKKAIVRTPGSRTAGG